MGAAHVFFESVSNTNGFNKSHVVKYKTVFTHICVRGFDIFISF